MRGIRAIIPIMAYIVVLGIFVLVQFKNYGSTMNYQELQNRGRDLGFLLLYIQIFLVLVLSPAYAASAITTEKERETFDIMQATLLSGRDIISGKVFSGFSYAALLVISSLPLLALSFWMGGFDFSHLFWGFMIVATCALIITCTGIFVSTVVSRSYMATGITYGVIFAGFGISMILNLILQNIHMRNATIGLGTFSWDTVPMWLGFTLNPLFMMQALDKGDIDFYTGVGGYYVNPLIDFFDTLAISFNLPYIAVHVIFSIIIAMLLIQFSSYFLFKSSREDNK